MTKRCPHCHAEHCRELTPACREYRAALRRLHAAARGDSAEVLRAENEALRSQLAEIMPVRGRRSTRRGRR